MCVETIVFKYSFCNEYRSMVFSKEARGEGRGNTVFDGVSSALNLDKTFVTYKASGSICARNLSVASLNF